MVSVNFPIHWWGDLLKQLSFLHMIHTAQEICKCLAKPPLERPSSCACIRSLQLQENGLTDLPHTMGIWRTFCHLVRKAHVAVQFVCISRSPKNQLCCPKCGQVLASSSGTKGTLSGRQSADIPTRILQPACKLGVSWFTCSSVVAKGGALILLHVWPRLRSLSLQNNRLTSLPESFCQLTRLRLLGIIVWDSQQHARKSKSTTR